MSVKTINVSLNQILDTLRLLVQRAEDSSDTLYGCLSQQEIDAITVLVIGFVKTGAYEPQDPRLGPITVVKKPPGLMQATAELTKRH